MPGDAVPMFVKLRGAYFHEDGYCLDAYRVAPMGLRKESNAVFASLDENGKPYRICQVPGCEGTGDPQLIIMLRPWSDAEKARGALGVACSKLRGALAGDREAKQALGDAWIYLLVRCLSVDARTQFDGLCNLYGKGRVMGTLNGSGTLAALGAPDSVKMVDEAFGLQ